MIVDIVLILGVVGLAGYGLALARAAARGPRDGGAAGPPGADPPPRRRPRR
jgi:hypothetical protein